MRVLVPVENYRFGEAIASFIAKHYWKLGTEFRVIKIVEPLLANHYSESSIMKLKDEYHQQLMTESTHLVDRIGLLIQKSLPQVIVSKQVLEGPVKELILSIANEWPADLIVSGSHGRSGLNHFFLGSISLKLVAEAPCALLLIKPDSNRLMTWEKLDPLAPAETAIADNLNMPTSPSEFRILVAIDEKESTDEIVELVKQHHWAQPTHIKLISILGKSHSNFLPSSPELNEFYENTSRIRNMSIKNLALKLKAQYPILSIEDEVIHGDPKRMIVEAAKDWKADLIVVGCRAEQPFKKLLFGSVSLAVLCTAPCTVLLLRQKTQSSSPARKRILEQNELVANTRNTLAIDDKLIAGKQSPKTT